eukprot:TRINITY_DN54207_c0_g1_i2.p2 TRINITY_DN54207_c0_g1~~TRINITY_DN54207_c0_g1_i2.p2  ORF type:complete len:126 (-),score=12.94 TRINITY_DN54207_c0_g1_i2:135-512(-)
MQLSFHCNENPPPPLSPLSLWYKKHTKSGTCLSITMGTLSLPSKKSRHHIMHHSFHYNGKCSLSKHTCYIMAFVSCFFFLLPTFFSPLFLHVTQCLHFTRFSTLLLITRFFTLLLIIHVSFFIKK